MEQKEKLILNLLYGGKPVDYHLLKGQILTELEKEAPDYTHNIFETLENLCNNQYLYEINCGYSLTQKGVDYLNR
jgi:hypothetical protein